MKKALKLFTWLLMGVAVVFFWLSLRSTEGNLEYTLWAMGAIALAWISNYFLRRYEKKEKQD
ncbi:hypothetical protein [Marinoscillum furvescens]|uniref:Uncharacterized protein n=1 Tax=Marinoscillum furvescens DSM 4134 TaxID=1122208 RepID=A0A3D9L282_MARFU|nr:hypothetical protein [Marinoscillum furvescens]RED97496.1 hypothetical protein C7460_112106 [Marinoscillum furvescens DSM 4134]